MKDINKHLKMFDVFKTCTNDEKEEILSIYNDLEKKGKILVHRTLKKYEHGKAASIFNESYLIALCENLKIEIADKVRREVVDREGMWNYLAKSFSNKCQDYYNSEINTQTRGGVDHSIICNENKDKIDHENSINFEDNLILEKEINNIVNYLENFDKPKRPYSKIIKYMLEGYTLREIQGEFPFSASTLERHKRKACEILLDSKEFNKDRLEGLLPQEKLMFLYLKPKLNPYSLEEHIYKEYKFKKNQIIGELKFSVKVKQNEHGKSKTLNEGIITLSKVKGNNQEEVSLQLEDVGFDRKKENLKKKISKGFNEVLM